MPDEFRFCFKAWRNITHVKKLEDCTDDIFTMLKVLLPARDKCGPILFQLPPSLHATAMPFLNNVLSQVTGSGWQAAVEFRHPSWYNLFTVDLLARYGAALVRHDMHGSTTPVLPLEDKLVYMRFHGAGVKYGGDYGRPFLQKLADRLETRRHDTPDTYVFFNNTMGAATTNAADFMQILCGENT